MQHHGASSIEPTSIGTNTTLNQQYNAVLCTANVTITLPLAASFRGQEYSIDAGGFSVTVARSGSDLIHGESSWNLSGNSVMHVHSTGTAWRFI